MTMMPPTTRPKKGSVPKGGSWPGGSSAGRPSPPRSPAPLAGQTDRQSRRPSGVTKPIPSHGAPKKRAQVRNACMHCRNDKVKCSGTHPICSRCSSRNLDCSWDVPEEGITKTQHLQRRLAEAAARLDRANAMVHILCHGTDKEATEALARLRMGESFDEVLRSNGTFTFGASDLEQMDVDQIEEALSAWSPSDAAVYDPLLMQTGTIS